MSYMPHRPWWEPTSDDIIDHFQRDSGLWTHSPVVSGSAINPYSAIATNPRVAHGTRRQSCRSIQVANSVDCKMYLTAGISLDTDCCVWFRCNTGWQITTAVGANQNSVVMYLSEDNNLFTNHYVGVSPMTVTSGGSAHVAQFNKKDTGGSSVVGISTNGTGNKPHDMAIAGVQKISNVMYGFAADDNGSIFRLGNFTYSGNTLDNLGFNFYGAGESPGGHVFDLDFVAKRTGIVVPF